MKNALCRACKTLSRKHTTVSCHFGIHVKSMCQKCPKMVTQRRDQIRPVVPTPNRRCSGTKESDPSHVPKL